MSFLSVSCLFRQGYRVHLMNLTMKVIQQQQQEQQMVVVTVIEVVLVVSYPALTMMRCLCLLLPSRYCDFPVKIIDFFSKLDFHSILPMTRPTTFTWNFPLIFLTGGFGKAHCYLYGKWLNMLK